MFENVTWSGVLSAIGFIVVIFIFGALVLWYEKLSTKGKVIFWTGIVVFIAGGITILVMISNAQDRRYGAAIELCSNLDTSKPSTGSIASNAKIVFIPVSLYNSDLPDARKANSATEIEGIVCIYQHKVLIYQGEYSDYFLGPTVFTCDIYRTDVEAYLVNKVSGAIVDSKQFVGTPPSVSECPKKTDQNLRVDGELPSANLVIGWVFRR